MIEANDVSKPNDDDINHKYNRLSDDNDSHWDTNCVDDDSIG